MLRFMMAAVLLTNIPPPSTGEESDLTWNVAEAPQEVRDQFDQFPLISKTVTNSDWCEVTVTLWSAILHLGFHSGSSAG